jgi:transposase-like protein
MGLAMDLQGVARLTEDEARQELEAVRWPNGPVCPHCGGTDRIYPIRGDAARPGLFECGSCSDQFTVTVGTVMHKSKIPLSKWVMAFHMICAHKKGISALQLQRDLGLGSYRTAWHMAHRIRMAMKEDPLASLLRGQVEVDETYVGGKPRKGGGKRLRGRGTSKTPVMALVERKGRVRAHPIENVYGKTLKGAIRQNVHPNSTIMTDEFSSYHGIGRGFRGGHQTVNHGRGEYARGSAHVNTAESYFALLKRGVVGSFHHVSKKHLHRYCDEFSFRWNARKLTDHEAARLAMKGADGKRLLYKTPLGTA